MVQNNFFILLKAAFCVLKRSLLRYETRLIGFQNGAFQKSLAFFHAAEHGINAC